MLNRVLNYVNNITYHHVFYKSLIITNLDFSDFLAGLLQRLTLLFCVNLLCVKSFDPKQLC